MRPNYRLKYCRLVYQRVSLYMLNSWGLNYIDVSVNSSPGVYIIYALFHINWNSWISRRTFLICPLDRLWFTVLNMYSVVYYYYISDDSRKVYFKLYSVHSIHIIILLYTWACHFVETSGFCTQNVGIFIYHAYTA